MNKIVKHTIQSRYALLFLAVFVGSLLVKPAHLLFAHHGHSEAESTHHDGQTVSNNHNNDCPVCDFEFCTFIPQKQITVPQISVIVREDQPVRTVACLAVQSSHLFQLRAPPAL